MPETEKQFLDRPNMWVLIPVATKKYEKHCCAIQATPLRVCVAITMHKSQRMTVGLKYLPELSSHSPPGLELIAILRAMKPKSLAIGNDLGTLSKMFIKKIGTSKAYDL